MSASNFSSNPGVGSNTGIRVALQSSSNRQAPKTSFGTVLQTGMGRAAGAVMGAGSLAAPFVPGGAVVSAAINGVATAGNAASGGGGLVGGNAMGVGGVGGGLGGLGGGMAPTGNPMIDAQAKMMEMNQSFNMQYLGLQQQMQNENRQFTTLSNVLKTKHDTAKGAINNIK